MGLKVRVEEGLASWAAVAVVGELEGTRHLNGWNWTKNRDLLYKRDLLPYSFSVCLDESHTEALLAQRFGAG